MGAKIWNPRTWFRGRGNKEQPLKDSVSPISPGRVSVPDGPPDNTFLAGVKDLIPFVEPSFRTDLIPLIRDLYKVNPDVSIALQDMFKLANTGHSVSFPYNTEKEAEAMKKHLDEVSKKWSKYTAGIDGLVNKMMVQCLVSGAISIEGVPNRDLSGLSTILFIKPESIFFRRLNNGVYHPYQKNPYADIGVGGNKKQDFIKLNTETYVYAGMFNDLDEPYGVPPFMAALDSLKGQHDMRTNFKHIMELMGMVGFLEAKLQKPPRTAGESTNAYEHRLNRLLRDLKRNLVNGMRDGVVTGFIDDHEFKLNSTSASLQNLDKPWNMNQQSVANGLGVTGTMIGVDANTTEGGTGVLLSKMISQLKNIQVLTKYVLEFIYTLELRLAGYNNKGVKVSFYTSTISDELKVQQGREYKIRNLSALYNQGIISQNQFAREMGYERADQSEPRAPIDGENGVSSVTDNAKKQKREGDKDASDRKTRDKNKPVPKRADQDTRKR